MATNQIAFSLKVNGVDQAVSSIDELDSSIQQLEETLKGAKFGTDAFKSVEQQLIKARSAKEDLDKSLEGRGAEKRLQGIVGLAEGVGGAFAIASQASALFGKESADMAKVEAKAQQALAVVMGIRSIKEGLLNSALERKIILEKASAAGTVVLNGINKVLNTTLKANPIGLIITAVGLLVVGIAAAIGPIKKFIQNFDFLSDAIQFTVDKARDLASFLSFGLIDDAATAKTRDNSQKMVDALDDAGSAANRQIADSKRRLDLMTAQGATEEQLLAQKKKINKEEVASRTAAVNALIKLQKMDGELDDEKKKKLVDLQNEIKDLNNQALIDQAEFDKNKQSKADDAAKEAADKQRERSKTASDKAAAERDKAIELRRGALERIKKLEDDYYLKGIEDKDTRDREALRIQQEAEDKTLQVQIEALNKKKKLSKEELALRGALLAEQIALDKKQGIDTEVLTEEQTAAKLELEKQYNLELLGLQNELTLLSIDNANERAIKELEIQLTSQIAEINSRKLTEEQKGALIAVATATNADKVKTIEEAQVVESEALAQEGANFKFGLLEEGYSKQIATIDLERDAKIKQLELLKLSEEDYAAAVVAINAANAEAKDAIGKAQLNEQLAATAQTLGGAADLFGENTIAYKALKIAETGITTYTSATAAFNSVVGIPVVGPVLAPIAAGTAVASGLASIAKIAGIQIPGKGGGGDQPPAGPRPSKFAMGGIVVGSGGPTSDTVPAMLSPGEAVINARSTEMFSGILSSINTMGGGSALPAGGGETPIIKTYVVASDMSNQQEADKRINDIAKI